jgi:hypothetical protein
MLENFFTQSPIHGSGVPKGKAHIFQSIDDFIRESGANRNYNSVKKGDDNEDIE